MDFSLTLSSTSQLLHLVLHLLYLAAIGKAGIPMSRNNSFSHLTLEERRIILTGITNGSSKTAIAQTIGKDKLKCYNKVVTGVANKI